MDLDELTTELDAFEGSEQARRAVVRQARDLADSGRIADTFGYELTVDDVVSHLDDAPDEYDLVDRWNWWIGSLDLADGTYHRFRVRPDIRSE